MSGAMSQRPPVRIATRGSDLALAQAKQVASRVEKELGCETDLLIVTTSGDRIQDRPLADLGGKGLFVKEIEEALLEGRADLAVHSAKDLPGELAPGLRIAVFPEREDPRDALVFRGPAQRLADLPSGARVGTGSARRGAQLRLARGDLEIVPIRGNVPTRIRKLEEDGLDAVVLASAGLERLGLADRIGERVDPSVMLPAVCQGTLALETRDDDALASELARLADPEAARSAAAERAFLLRLGGDCHVPIAAHAASDAEGGLRMRGLVASPDGSRCVRDEARASSQGDAAAAALGEQLAERLLEAGASEILAALPGREAP